MPPPDELDLVRRLLARDRAAWGQFVCRYQGLVLSRVQRTATDQRGYIGRADAEDICAEVFASLLANDLSSLRGFEGRSSLATWLAVIARRVCLKQLSRIPLDCQLKCAASDALHEVSTTAAGDALQQLIQAEDRARLRAKIDCLRVSDREILNLFYEEGLGYSEISRRLGISVNTVGPKLHRAQSRLRKLLRST